MFQTSNADDYKLTPYHAHKLKKKNKLLHKVKITEMNPILVLIVPSKNY